MKKLIIIRNAADGLGELLKAGSESVLEKLPLPDPNRPEKKRRVVLINHEGSSDPNEKNVSQVLSASDLGENEKPAKKKRHLKQLFTKAIAGGADIVIIDNGTEEVVSEADCRSDGKTFEYETIEFVNIEQIIPGQEEKNGQISKKKGWGLSFKN